MASRKSASDRIKEEAAARDIACLVHFTLLANLPGIVENGLLSRKDLIAGLGDGVASAPTRIGGGDDAVSVSISAMNWAMFSSKRKAHGDAPWVVLLLDPAILWTHPCKIFSLNAAKSVMKHHRGRLDGPWGFSQMFSDEHQPPNFRGLGYRKTTRIPDCLPTRPEAEVQVFSAIRPQAIIEAWVETERNGIFVDDELAKIDGSRHRVVNVRPFAPRHANEYSAWG